MKGYIQFFSLLGILAFVSLVLIPRLTDPAPEPVAPTEIIPPPQPAPTLSPPPPSPTPAPTPRPVPATPPPPPTQADIYGRKPVFSKSLFGDGYTIPRAVERAVKRALRDPDSFQVVSLNAMDPAEWQGTKCYQIIFTYRARNGFGGMEQMAAMAYVRESTLLHIEFYDE